MLNNNKGQNDNDQVHVSKWRPYSDLKKTEFQSKENIKVFLKQAYNKKNYKTVLHQTFLLLFYQSLYYTWDFWRWFRPHLYQRLLKLFIQDKTGQEETTLIGLLNYSKKEFLRELKSGFFLTRNQIVDNWTFETSLRAIILPLGLILGCWQASYARYSFLFLNQSKITSTSWLNFCKKQKKKKSIINVLNFKKIDIYDKFLLIELKDTDQFLRITLPPNTSNKEIFLNLKEKTSNGTNLLTDRASAESRPPLSKNRYKKNFFRTKELSKSDLPKINFFNESHDYNTGFLYNLTCIIKLYAAFFPVWACFIIKDQINASKTDNRKTKARKIGKSTNKKKFKDIAGLSKLIPDLNELVQSLKSKKKGIQDHISFPKGYLLVGPPGTGKTLLAQAIAGEANVTFFFTAGSEFKENQSGVGAARLRDLFRKAKKESPSIIFIDEIDALGKAREGCCGEFNSNYEDSSKSKDDLQLLTEFLVQMDGFSERNNVVVIAATNFVNSLDPAFIRPGRFDRIFQLELPSKLVRIEILKLHIKNKTQATDPILWDYFGRCTSGFSGADLSAMVNESLLKIIRDKQNYHTNETLKHGLNRISTYSTESASATNDIFLKTRLSYYQAGLGIIHLITPELESKLNLELHPRPKNLRYSKKIFLEQNISKKHLESKVLGYLAGIAAEFYVLTELNKFQDKKDAEVESFWISQQGQDALEKATHIIITMVDKYGMYNKEIFLAQNQDALARRASARFSQSETYSYNQLLLNRKKTFLNIMNEQNKEGVLINWRFLDFWIWQTTNKLFYSKMIPKWSKSRTKSTQKTSDEYFYTNQGFESNLGYQQQRDILIQTILKDLFQTATELLISHRNLLDLIAHKLIIEEQLTEIEINKIYKNYIKNN